MTDKQKNCKHTKIETKVVCGISENVKPPYPVFGKIDYSKCGDCGLVFLWDNFSDNRFVQLIPKKVRVCK